MSDDLESKSRQLDEIKQEIDRLKKKHEELRGEIIELIEDSGQDKHDFGTMNVSMKRITHAKAEDWQETLSWIMENGYAESMLVQRLNCNEAVKLTDDQRTAAGIIVENRYRLTVSSKKAKARSGKREQIDLIDDEDIQLLE